MEFSRYMLAIVVATGLTAPSSPALSADTTTKDILWQLSCNEPLSSDRRTTCMAEIDFFGTPIDSLAVTSVRHILSMVASLHSAFPAGTVMNYRAVLDSPGGDVDAAMEIGRLLRERSADTDVHHDMACVSACVLVSVAGKAREIEGKVGIHRPYMDVGGSASLPSEQQIQSATNRVRDKLVAYMHEMNIPSNIVDDMLLIPPEKVRWLDHKGLAHYGIFEFDPVYNEAVDIAVARSFGLSREDYMRRKMLVFRNCPNTAPSADPFENFNNAETFSFLDCPRQIMSAPLR